MIYCKSWIYLKEKLLAELWVNEFVYSDYSWMPVFNINPNENLLASYYYEDYLSPTGDICGLLPFSTDSHLILQFGKQKCIYSDALTVQSKSV